MVKILVYFCNHQFVVIVIIISRRNLTTPVAPPPVDILESDEDIPDDE